MAGFSGRQDRIVGFHAPDPNGPSASSSPVARAKGTSVNALIVEALAAEIERVRADKDFTTRARKLLARDKELLDRLAR
jgi:hypothetical protein